MYPCPAEWTPITLEPDPELGTIERCTSGATPSTRHAEYWDGGVPWLTPKEIARHDEIVFVSHTERTISHTGVEASGTRVHPPGTVLLTKRAPVGAVAINTVPMATNQGFLAFSCGPRLRPTFLALWLRTNRRYLRQIANGSTYLELYAQDLFEFELALPPLDVQDAVVETVGALRFVGALDAALAQATRDPEKLREIHRQTRRLEQLRSRVTTELLAGRLKA